jgi:hypothetical protein
MTTSLTDGLFLSNQLCRLAQITRRQLQMLHEADDLVPTRHDKGGPLRGHRWSVMQVLGAAYYAAFLRAGSHASWGHDAAAWVSRQDPEALFAALAKGRTLLSLSPDGRGWLVAPCLRPDASRKQRIMLAELDLAKIKDALGKRIDLLADRFDRWAGGESLGPEEVSRAGGRRSG